MLLLLASVLALLLPLALLLSAGVVLLLESRYVWAHQILEVPFGSYIPIVQLLFWVIFGVSEPSPKLKNETLKSQILMGVSLKKVTF